MKTSFMPAGVLIAFQLLMFNASAAQWKGIELKPHAPPAGAASCVDCHTKKTLTYVPSKFHPKREHREITAKHGKIEISCNNCHDTNHSNLIRTSAKFPADFVASSAVCQRCHSRLFSDWEHGIHGKRSGGWDTRNTGRRQWNCVDCHTPHGVSFANPMDSENRPNPPNSNRLRGNAHE